MIALTVLIPKVVVVVVADQFRYDYLAYGFGEILRNGYTFTNCHHVHIPTYTAVGHATISTGVEPRIHGIVSNHWFDRNRGGFVSSVYDDRFDKSPHNLRVPTIGDHVKIRYGYSKVISISLKDRAAILLGGYTADVVLWLDKEGKFTTSRYYRKPPWIDEFNKSVNLKTDKDKIFEGNKTLLRLFKEAFLRENVGKDTFPDIVFISLSSLDYAGHSFGPHSKAVTRLVKQIDSILNNIISFLNKNVGKGNYLLVFTSDHGVAPIPAGIGGRFRETDMVRYLNDTLKKIFHRDSVVLTVSSHLLYLNYENIKDINRRLIVGKIKDILLRNEAVLRVYSEDEIDGIIAWDFIDTAVINGFNRVSGADMVIVLKPYWIYSNYANGTNHGSPYFYDTHVPLIFYGLDKGESNEKCSITFLAEKIRKILGLP